MNLYRKLHKNWTMGKCFNPEGNALRGEDEGGDISEKMITSKMQNKSKQQIKNGNVKKNGGNFRGERGGNSDGGDGGEFRIKIQTSLMPSQNEQMQQVSTNGKMFKIRGEREWIISRKKYMQTSQMPFQNESMQEVSFKSNNRKVFKNRGDGF